MTTRPKLENLTTIFCNLNNNEITDLVLVFVFLMVIYLIWRWVLFKNGAYKWMRQMMDYREMIGQRADPESFFFKPIILKILFTIMLLCCSVAAIFIIINIFQK
jgi:hypothetical protein